MYRCVSVYGFVHVHERMQSPEKDDRFLGPGITGGRDLPDMGAEVEPGFKHTVGLLNVGF